MVDYHKISGTTGDMMIRDLGSAIEFWFRAGYDNDHWDPLKFSITANGTTTNHNIDYNTGRPWVKVGQRTVTTSQTVTFRLLTDTDTNGMGGPTTFAKAIVRGKVPGAPTAVMLSNITFNSLTARFYAGASNGLTMDAHQLARNTSNTTTGATIVYSNGTTNVTGLAVNTKYYFWARSHNSAGWGPWSPVSVATTSAGAWIKQGLVWKRAIPYVRVGGVWKQATPYARRLGIWKQGQ